LNLTGSGGPVCAGGLGTLGGSITFSVGIANSQPSVAVTATSSPGSIHLVIGNANLSFVAIADLAWVDVGGSSACATGTGSTVTSSGTMVFEGP
jgi:hypothetical protein